VKASQTQSSVINDGEPIVCRYFLRGGCKYGFFGKGKAGQGKCPFLHPKPCRKLMDNGSGEGGCSKGKTCEAAHPKMCHQSLSSRTCSNIKDGARCTGGYHVRGTKVPAPKPLGDNTRGSRATPEAAESRGGNKRDTNPSSASPSPSQDPYRHSATTIGPPLMGEQQLALSAVFSEIIRAEVIKLLQTGTLWPQITSQQGGQVVSPPVSPPVQKGQDSSITMGNLGALLSLLGAQHQ
jgi:hypothetical protein